MSHWKRVFEQQARASDDPMRQVGKTVNQKPVGDEQLGMVVDDIVRGLELDGSQRLLDLGCGNGLVTSRVAAHADSIQAVDFVGPMIEIAKRRHALPNISYEQGNVLDVDVGEAAFHGIYMVELAQHLQPADLRELLGRVRAWLIPGGRALVCGVPDLQRKWAYYDTPEKRAYCERMEAAGTPHLGVFYAFEEIESWAKGLGFEVRCVPQAKGLYSAYYRYNVWLRRSA